MVSHDIEDFIAVIDGCLEIVEEILSSMDRITIADLRIFVEDYVSDETSRTGFIDWWQTPLLASAPIDQRFDILPRIASSDHLHPYDLLQTAKSVVVFFIPFKRDLVKENKNGDRPCRNWGLAYVHTNDHISRLSLAIKGYLSERGFQSALTPATHNFDSYKSVHLGKTICIVYTFEMASIIFAGISHYGT